MEAILNKVRAACEKRGTNGTRKLIRTFCSFDDDGNWKLNFEEFMNGLTQYETGVTREEGQMFFEKLDRDKSGKLSLVEFTNMLWEPLNAQCLEAVNMVFAKLDKTEDGSITSEDLRKCYKPRDGTSFDEYLATYDGSDAKAGPVEVTREEFIEHYTKQRATKYQSDEELISAVKGDWDV